MIPIATFVAPSFWMNLPSRVIHIPKNGLMKSRVKGLHAWSGFEIDLSMEGKHLFFLMWLQPALRVSILVFWHNNCPGDELFIKNLNDVCG